MDAVAVEGQGREAEEEHRIGGDAAAPGHVGRGRLAARGPGCARRTGPPRGRPCGARPPWARPSGPKTRPAMVAKTRVPVPPVLMEMSASSVSRRTASPRRSGRWKRTRSPANMRRGSDGRYHAGVARATVRAQICGRDTRQEVEREPPRRQRVALAELGLLPAERQPQQIRRAGVEKCRSRSACGRCASSDRRC